MIERILFVIAVFVFGFMIAVAMDNRSYNDH